MKTLKLRAPAPEVSPEAMNVEINGIRIPGVACLGMPSGVSIDDDLMEISLVLLVTSMAIVKDE